MRFAEKLQTVLRELGCRQITLGRQSGLNPSLISRFCSGHRIPVEDGAPLIALCLALAKIAIQVSKCSKLAALCNSTANHPTDLASALQRWFSQPDSGLRSRKKARRNTTLPLSSKPLSRFGEKLHLLLGFTRVSNARLARELHVDPSYISRFRSGSRAPDPQNPLIDKTAQYMARRIAEQGLEQELSEFLHLPHGTSHIEQTLGEWLRNDSLPAANFRLEQLVDALRLAEPYTPPPETVRQSPPLQLPSLPEAQCCTGRYAFWGYQGLRMGILHMLALAQKDPSPVLYLYSDMGLNWMLDDPDFFNIWTSTLRKMLERGGCLHIIHSEVLRLPEIIAGIERELPMYMTGRVNAYCCHKARNERFSMFRLVLSGHASLTATSVRGTEDAAEYLYCIESRHVTYAVEQFLTLLDASSPVLQILCPEPLEQHRQLMSRMITQNGDITIFTPSLFEGSLNESLCLELLRSNRLPTPVQRELLPRMLHRTQLFHHELTRGRLTEFVYLAPPDEVAAGKVLSGAMTLLMSDPTLVYTPAVYAAHLRYMAQLLRSRNQFHVHLLPQLIFHKMQVHVKNGVGTTLLTQASPTRTIMLLYPELCKAVEQFCVSLYTGICTREYREQTIDHLERHAEAVLRYAVLPNSAPTPGVFHA